MQVTVPIPTQSCAGLMFSMHGIVIQGSMLRKYNSKDTSKEAYTHSMLELVNANV